MDTLYRKAAEGLLRKKKQSQASRVEYNHKLFIPYMKGLGEMLANDIFKTGKGRDLLNSGTI